MQPGDACVLRSVYRARVRSAFPKRLIADGEQIALYLPIGAEGFWMGRDPDGRYLRRWMGDEPPHAHVWHSNHVLWLARPGEASMLGLLWDETWRFRGWYVNLQEPLRRTALGFDTLDLALDVWVEPTESWTWKDEDDFAEAQALGILDERAAAAIRAEGERVLAEKPWPTGWEDWRPDPRWTIPSLPEHWDIVQAPSN